MSSCAAVIVRHDERITIIANGCYRWLARQLKGFDRAKPKLQYRKFVETGDQIEVQPSRRLLVTFERRSYNRILRELPLTGTVRQSPS